MFEIKTPISTGPRKSNKTDPKTGTKNGTINKSNARLWILASALITKLAAKITKTASMPTIASKRHHHMLVDARPIPSMIKAIPANNALLESKLRKLSNRVERKRKKLASRLEENIKYCP